MTQTMRERLVEAANSTLTAIEWGDHIDPGAAMVDAILSELREPDEVMREEAIISQFDFAQDGSEAVVRAFTAMIDAIREDGA